MAVNWNWKKMGYAKAPREDSEGKTYKVKVRIEQGSNCLFALCAFAVDNGDKEHKNTYCFWGFANDKKHFSNCLGLTKAKYQTETENLYEGWEWHLNTFYKECQEMAQLLAKTKSKVVLFYKEPKAKK